MSSLFVIRHVETSSGVAEPLAFWVESTAPLNVDGVALHADPELASEFRLAPSDPVPTIEQISEQIDLLADAIAQKEGRAQLVVAIHGYNNSIEDAMRWMEKLYSEAQAEHRQRDGRLEDTIFIGYHWPSEKLGEPGRPLRALWTSAPASFRWLGSIAFVLCIVALYGFSALINMFPGLPARTETFVGIGLTLAALSTLALLVRFVRPLRLLAAVVALLVAALLIVFKRIGFWVSGLPFGVFSGILFSIPLALAILRFSSYFRDQFRATQYGIPDMVDFFQKLDGAVAARLKADVGLPLERRTPVSFLGHSMGAYVVTGLVRILTDVFQSGYDAKTDTSDPSVGKTLKLERLVLVSPDIPAEALRAGRSNFLGPSLRRFREAYLFSNGGDEVLRVIATIGNYILFPAATPDRGDRLGNVTLAEDFYGVHNRAQEESPEHIVGHLQVNSRPLTEAGGGKSGKAEARDARFTIVDCTDFVENGRAPLGRLWPDDRPRALRTWDHFRHLIDYARKRVDGHSGYFEANSVRRLILRFVCLGWDETLAREERLSQISEKKTFSQFCIDRKLKIRRGSPSGQETREAKGP